MKKIYLRSTKNLYYRDENGIRVFYSYSTPVAFENQKNGFSNRWISKNVWSITTAKHLNWIEDHWGQERKSNRSEHQDFKKELEQARGQSPDNSGPDPLKTTAMVSKLFGLLSTNDDKAMAQKKRFFEIAGCTFPDDWEQLSLEEKQSRLSKVEDLGLGKA